jgi:hypothetical protein
MATKKTTKKEPKSTAPSFEVEEVRVNYGMTLNIGNYESFRADAGCTIKATKKVTTKTEADKLRKEMYEAGWEVVKDELRKQVKAVRESSNK